jgi:hemerythrin-like domain-containing protein
MMLQVGDPIQRLKREHDATLEQLDRMELAVTDLNGVRRNQAFQLLRSGLEHLEQEVRAHSALEEEVLYPALGRHVPKQTVDVMLQEHQELWWEMDQLDQALRSDEIRTNEIRWHTIALLDLLRRHIDKENNVIFMMTAQMLSQQEYRDLGEALAKMCEARREQT